MPEMIRVSKKARKLLEDEKARRKAKGVSASSRAFITLLDEATENTFPEQEEKDAE